MARISPFRPQAYLFNDPEDDPLFDGDNTQPPEPPGFDWNPTIGGVFTPPGSRSASGPGTPWGPPGAGGQSGGGPGLITPPPIPPTQEGDDYLTEQGYIWTAGYDTDKEGNSIGGLKWIKGRFAPDAEVKRIYPKGEKKELRREAPGIKTDAKLLEEGPPETPPGEGNMWVIGDVRVLEYDDEGKYLGTTERGRGWKVTRAPSPPPPPLTGAQRQETITHFGQTFPKPWEWDEDSQQWGLDITKDNTLRDNAFQDNQAKLLKEGKDEAAKLAKEKFEYDKAQDAIKQRADEAASKRQAEGQANELAYFLASEQDKRAQKSWQDTADFAAQQTVINKQAKALGEGTQNTSDYFRLLNFLKQFTPQGQPDYKEFLAQLPQGRNAPEWLTRGGEELWNAPTGANWLLAEAQRQGLIPSPQGSALARPTAGSGTAQDPWREQRIPFNAPPDVQHLQSALPGGTAYERQRRINEQNALAMAYDPAARLGQQAQAFYTQAKQEGRNLTEQEERQVESIRQKQESAEYNLPWKVQQREREAREQLPSMVRAKQRRPFWQV